MIGIAASVTPTASAFDCNGAERCPYVKISNHDRIDKNAPTPDEEATRYDASGYIYDFKDPEKKHIYDWYEQNPVFTLWHWRWNGNGAGQNWMVHIRVDSWTDPGTVHKYMDFDVKADKSICIGVDRSGPYLSNGCTDAEDPADGATG